MGKNTVKLLVKLLLTALALYLVFRKIDTGTTLQIIQAADRVYLFLALLLFILSKIFSALRLNYYFKDLALHLSTTQNIKLYGIGMFYNLFLPGGIGGDGYKVFLLNKSYKTPVRQLLQAVLLDRINGLVVLVFFLFVLLFWVDFQIELPIARTTIASLGIVLMILSFSLMMRFLFPRFLASTAITLFYSLFVQLAQLVSAFFILKALGITVQIIEYQFVFLLSSIVAVLPLTIGGVGARELVFIVSHDYMGIDQNAAVAFSLLFFLITAVTSLLGAFMKSNDNKPLHAEYKEL